MVSKVNFNNTVLIIEWDDSSSGKHSPTVKHALLGALRAQTRANQHTDSGLCGKHAAELKQLQLGESLKQYSVTLIGIFDAHGRAIVTNQDNKKMETTCHY